MARRFAEALTALDHPLVRDVADPARLYLAARALGGLGRLDEALDAADRALSLKPDCPKTQPFRELLTTAIAARARQDAPMGPAEAIRLARLFEAGALGPAAGSVLEQIITEDAVAGEAEAAEWVDAAELALPLLGPGQGPRVPGGQPGAAWATRTAGRRC